MFFYRYNKLSPEYIAEGLGKAPAAKSVFGADISLEGTKLKLILENGPVLDYSFLADGMLSLAEDAAAAVQAPYKALEIKNIVLIAHLVPGTVRSYNIVWDRASGYVTVFSAWFCGYTDEREVQRKIYYGWAEGTDTEKGEKHSLTNRIEGKGFYWKDDTGVEILDFFPSIMYSTFVEISNPRGGITISTPADYIKINDRHYIYSRVECEYSGTFTLEVIDLFNVTKIGVRLGFDEKDALDYRMYHASGKITGQAAYFEPMTDYGNTHHFESLATQSTGESRRPVYRPGKMHPQMTWDEVKAAAATATNVFTGKSIMVGKNDMELSEYMVGKSFTLKFDNGGPAWDYEVVDKTTLKWREVGEAEWHEETYRGYEPAEDIILFAHMHTGSENYRCVNIAADFSNGLVTLVDSHIGNYRTEWEVGNSVHFGIIIADGIEAPLVRRHGFTTDLVGKSYAWVYSENMSSIHVYSSPESYSWTIFLNNGAGGMTWSSPCFYVKLRDDAYLFCWVEETCNGSQGLMVFNPNIMHDAGYFFGVEPGVLKLTTMGAYARTAGTFDIMPYFENKNRK